MSVDFSSVSLGALGPLDLSSAQGPNVSEEKKLEKVSKAMESIFVSQLTSEFGKGIDGKPDPMSGGGQYADFIQQALTSAVSKGGGFGMAKIIQQFLTQSHQARMAHPDLHTSTPITPSTDATRPSSL